MKNLIKPLCSAFFLVLIIVAPDNAYSQNGLFLLGGFEYTGSTYHYKFQQNKSILRRDGPNAQFTCNAKIHYRFAKYFGLEVGVQLDEIDLFVYDYYFYKNSNIKTTKPNGGKNLNGGTLLVNNGEFDIAKLYLSPHIAGYYYLNLKSSNVQPYISGGIALNYLISHSQKYSSFLYQPTGEDLQLTSHFLSYYQNLFLEGGVFIYNRSKPNRVSYFVGLKYYFANNIMSGDYQNIQNGIIKYTDHVTASGSYLAFTLKIGGALFKTNKNKKMDKSNSVPPPVEKNSSTVKDSLKLIKPVVHSSDSVPKEMTGRAIEVHKIIKVQSQHVTLKIWDHESIDGDELSLNLNGNWILQDYVLQKQQKIMKHDLTQGVNYLLLYAKNEGRYKPCTSAIIIEDGFSSQLVILNSSFEISQAIQINVVK
jgi:hypothetical protein